MPVNQSHEAGEEGIKHIVQNEQSASSDPVFSYYVTPPRQPVKRILLIITPLLVLSLTAFFVVRQRAATVELANRASHKLVSALDEKEARAIWVVRYTMTSPESIRDSVKRAKAAGITDLVVQVRGRGDAFYNSELEPRAEELASQPNEFDPLALMCQEAHANGLRVHAWLNAYVVTLFDKLPKLPDHIVYQHPDWLMVPKPLGLALYRKDPKSPEYLEALRTYTRENRAVLEGIFASPAHPDVRAHMEKVWLDVATRYDIDGIHFDYIRYPNINFDYSRATLERFRAELEPTLDPPSRKRLAELAARNPLIYARTFADRYADFLRKQITETETAIYQAVKTRKPHLAVSAAVYSSANDDARNSRLQDWGQWVKNGTLDIVCPMAYTPDTKLFRKQMTEAVNAAAGRKLWGGIGSWRQPVNETLDKIKVTREVGAHGFILFSYDSAVQFSNLNPQKDYLERVRDGLAASAN